MVLKRPQHFCFAHIVALCVRSLEQAPERRRRRHDFAYDGVNSLKVCKKQSLMVGICHIGMVSPYITEKAVTPAKKTLYLGDFAPTGMC